MLRADSANCANSMMALSHNVHNRFTALTCKAGLARMHQHRAIAATLANLLKQSVAQVDKERPAPQMHESETNDKGGSEGNNLGPGSELSGAALHTLD